MFFPMNVIPDIMGRSQTIKPKWCKACETHEELGRNWMSIWAIKIFLTNFSNRTAYYYKFWQCYDSTCICAVDETVPHNRLTPQRRNAEVLEWKSQV